MIKFISKGLRNYPVIVCEVCGLQVENVKNGAVVLRDRLPEGEMTDAYFVHKDHCLEIAQTNLLQVSALPDWMELEAFLVQLVNSTGSSPDKLKEWDNWLKKFGI